MFREYLIVLLLGHILGDFYFQTKGMAEKKQKSIKWVFIHCLCYWGTMLFVSLPVISYEIVLAVTGASILHFAIDTAKYIYLSNMTKKSKMTQETERNMFFIDQILQFKNY